VTLSDSADDRSKEARICFESEAAASTAVLLNNALVDGRNIVVELVAATATGSGNAEGFGTGVYGGSQMSFDSASGARSSPSSTRASAVMNDIFSEAKSMASNVSAATRDLNAKYDVTGKLKSAYTSAATTTTATFKALDQQYDLKGQTSKAVDATKAGLTSVYKRMSGLWQQQEGSGPSAGSSSSLHRSTATQPSPSSNQGSSAGPQ
jgi:hypothetical protein